MNGCERPATPSVHAQCYGTRRILNGIVRLKIDSTWQRKYGVGECSICRKQVTAHKDGTAVQHVAAD